LWLYSLKVAQLLRSAACLHTNQSRSYLNHLVLPWCDDLQTVYYCRNFEENEDVRTKCWSSFEMLSNPTTWIHWKSPQNRLYSTFYNPSETEITANSLTLTWRICQIFFTYKIHYLLYNFLYKRVADFDFTLSQNVRRLRRIYTCIKCWD